MKPSRNTQSLLWSRLLLVSTVLALASASVLVGYASEALLTNYRHHTRHGIQTALLTPGERDSATEDDAAYTEPVDNYKTALKILQDKYYGAPIDAKQTQQLTYEAIRGMLATLHDQFSTFLAPQDWAQMQETTKGDFEGIGVIFSQEPPVHGDIRVVKPIETGPAEKVGIQIDDVLVKVDGKSVVGQDLNDIVNLVKGRRGSKVRIGILRDKKPLEFTIQRALVEPPVVKHWMEDPQNKIGHIVLTEFNEKSLEQLEHAYSELESQGMRALVFDLRYNPGGLLNVAIDVASAFIRPGQNRELGNAVVYVREANGKEQSYKLRDLDTRHRQVPMVVLTNSMSASASEIVCGALKDYGTATVIGERTYGKGLVQTLFPLDDRSALKLTTAKYYTPKHTDINRKRDEDGDPIPNSGGILPDIEVKQSEKWKAEDFKDKVNDVQLQKAIEFLRARLNNQTVAQAADLIKTR